MLTSLTGSGEIAKTRYQELRRLRLSRRQASSAVLISAARRQAGLPPVSPAGIDVSGSDYWVRPARPARCRWRVGAVVGVHHDGDAEQSAHFSGLERCGSIWACPVCSAVIRAERANDIERAVTAHQANGGGVALVTLTLRHTAQDQLKDTLDIVLKGWQRLINGKPWERFKDRHGISGYIRTVEVTHGKNGWHPHVHALLFFDGAAPGKDDVGEWLYGRWANIVQRLGARLPSRQHGLDYRVAGGLVGSYLAKVQDEGAKLSKELARSDLKDGRNNNRMPFQLLDGVDPGDGYLWAEYVEATRGRRAITWSRGLRDRLLVDEERTDEEILNDAERAAPVYLMDGSAWDDRLKNNPSLIAATLEATETAELELVHALVGGAGVILPDIGPDRWDWD